MSEVDAAAQAEIARFASDMLVTAGAGTGKTHALIGLYLRLVAGTTALGRRIPPGRIAALTFTDKAAAEMRARVRGRVIALAQAPRGDGELERAYADTGTTPLTAAEWDQVLIELGAASISTFHAFAGLAIRRAAAELGVDPAFRVLEDAAAEPLLGDAVQTVALAALERDSGVRALMGELELSAEGYGAGLVQILTGLVKKLSEQAAAPGERPLLAGDLGQARAAWTAGVKDMRARLAAARAGVSRERDLHRLPLLARALALLDRVGDPPTLHGAADLDMAIEAFAFNLHGAGDLRDARVRLSALAGDLTGAAQAAALAALAGEVRTVYQAAKAARGVLDFADLMAELRALTREPPLRRELAGRFDAILVDEYQDVSPVQGELIDALASEGARRFLVGDRKQSIYDFRGADVAVFARAEAPMRARGGQRVVLRQNRRSRPGVLAFANQLFARTLTQTQHDFDVSFTAEDALAPTRTGDGAAVQLLRIAPDKDRSSSDTRKLEAAAVARRIAELITAGTPLIEPRGQAPRPPRLGDVAILLRRFTHLDIYLSALRARGLPYYVVRGRGFFEQQEVRDLGAALTLLSDPDDELTLLTVLRSPLVALSDRTLVRIVAAQGRPLRLSAVRRAFDVVPDDERMRLGRWLGAHDRLSKALDRLGPGSALRALIEVTDLEAVLAAGFHGEQRLANLARLCELADRAGQDGTSARSFVRELGSSIAVATVAPPAQVLAENDDVVRVMTVHQSKGLEFGAVFVPDCGAEEQGVTARVLYDRDLGLAFRPHNPRTQKPAAAASWNTVQERILRRAEAESLRLFYVATTRARDLLVLSGERRKGRPWRTHVDELVTALGDDAAGLVTVVDGALGAVRAAALGEAPLAATLPALAAGAPLGPREAAETNDLVHLSLARQTVTRAAGPRPRPLGLTGSVTALADFQRCARRYRYHHELGLEEHPRPDDAAGDDLGALELEPPQTGGLGARGRGALAHRVLERLDLTLAARDPAAAMAQALSAEPTEAATAEELAKVRADLARWLATAAFRTLVLAHPDAVRREEPFALAVGDGPRLLLKGQIDLLVLDQDGGATVIDYKHARRESGRDHSFQLLSYALATERLTGRTPVRVGLAYLGDTDPTPEIITPSPERLAAFAAELAALARDLADARARDQYPGRERPHCEQLRCGYVSRCHPA